MVAAWYGWRVGDEGERAGSARRDACFEEAYRTSSRQPVVAVKSRITIQWCNGSKPHIASPGDVAGVLGLHGQAQTLTVRNVRSIGAMRDPQRLPGVAATA